MVQPYKSIIQAQTQTANYIRPYNYQLGDLPNPKPPHFFANVPAVKAVHFRVIPYYISQTKSTLLHLITMLIGNILGYFFSIQHPAWRAYARLRRATVHVSVVMRGRPIIRCTRGAKLIISEGVRISTSVAANPVIGRNRTAICAMAPGALLEIGPKVGMSGVCLCAAKSLRIGESTIIGADVLITDTDFHRPLPGWRWSNDAVGASKPVQIGRGCFIGARAIILKGVTLGDGAVVAAGALVTRDVPANHLAIGNPATVKPLAPEWIHPPEQPSPLSSL